MGSKCCCRHHKLIIWKSFLAHESNDLGNELANHMGAGRDELQHLPASQFNSTYQLIFIIQNSIKLSSIIML